MTFTLYFIQKIENEYNKINNNKFSGFLLISIGLFVVVTAANLDMANHWLNKPETFFSPPHAAVYTGVAIMISGSIWVLMRNFPSRNQSISNKYNHKQDKESGSESDRNCKYASLARTEMFPLSIKLIFYGVIVLALAGPFDLTWHTIFGLDGLLSPSHATFRIGQALCGIGAVLGIVSTFRSLDSTARHENRNIYLAAIIIAIASLWRVIGGVISMVTLPFSNTYNFQWNPDPLVAVIIATVLFPFFIALMLFCSFRLGNSKIDNKLTDNESRPSAQEGFKFGILTTTGAAYVIITLFTSIIPNKYLLTVIPFYLLNIVPIIAVDILLTKVYEHTTSNKSRKVAGIIAGAILGITFFTLQYPYIAYTYNEVLQNPEIISPLNVNAVYLEIIQLVPIIILPSMLAGIFGVLIASELLSPHSAQQLQMSS